MEDLKTTTICELVRREFSLSRDEYALLHYVQTWASHPDNPHPGWCSRTQEDISKWIGITPRALRNMQERMGRLGLLEKSPNGRARITAKWFNAVHLAKKQGEQTSHFTTLEGEQTSHFTTLDGNKLPIANGNKLPILGEQTSHFTTLEGEQTSLQYKSIIEEVNNNNKSTSSKTKKSQNEKPVSHPQFTCGHVDIFAEAENMKADSLYAETCIRVGCPKEHFAELVDLFAKDQAGAQQNYWSIADFRRHFRNWVAKDINKNKINKNGQQQQSDAASQLAELGI